MLSPNTALVIVAHGSRREASNEEIRTLVKTIAQTDHGFCEVKEGFLELADPLIPQAIIETIENGATEVVILPYFLSAGRHVTKDIPADVDKVRALYPHITLTIAPYLGSASIIPEIVLNQAYITPTKQKE